MEGGAAEAGNYKGVMLCNRPAEPTSAAQHMLTPSVDAPSFRPVGLSAEPLGLNPAKENLVSNVAAMHDEAARRRAGSQATLAHMRCSVKYGSKSLWISIIRSIRILQICRHDCNCLFCANRPCSGRGHRRLLLRRGSVAG